MLTWGSSKLVAFFLKRILPTFQKWCIKGLTAHCMPILTAHMLSSRPSIMHPGEWKVRFCNHRYFPQSTQIEASKINRILDVKNESYALGSWILSPVAQTIEYFDPDNTLYLPGSPSATHWFIGEGCLYFLISL